MAELTDQLQEIIELLSWIGTTSAKLVDINMLALGELNPDQVELLDYIHNQKNRFLVELTEAELTQYQQESHGN